MGAPCTDESCRNEVQLVSVQDSGSDMEDWMSVSIFGKVEAALPSPPPPDALAEVHEEAEPLRERVVVVCEGVAQEEQEAFALRAHAVFFSAHLAASCSRGEGRAS